MSPFANINDIYWRNIKLSTFANVNDGDKGYKNFYNTSASKLLSIVMCKWNFMCAKMLFVLFSFSVHLKHSHVVFTKQVHIYVYKYVFILYMYFLTGSGNFTFKNNTRLFQFSHILVLQYILSFNNCELLIQRHIVPILCCLILNWTLHCL